MQIELSEHEARQLTSLLDVAVRASGLTAAALAVNIAAKLEQAKLAEDAKPVRRARKTAE